MKSRHWLPLGTTLLTLGGWGPEAQATDLIVTFDPTAIAPNSPAAENFDGAIASPTQLANPDAHILGFAPPEMPPELPTTSASEMPPAVHPTAEQPVQAPASHPAIEKPLPLPDAPVPLGNAAMAPLPLPPLSPEVAPLFAGGENSVVAIAVGHAEGTRTVEGERTLAYYGHVDPGNQVWNQGTFSYQHEARSPEEADQKQLVRLQEQAKELHSLAFEKGITFTPTELLNGIDLANQAPQAALDRGYVDWLAEAQKMGLQGEEAVLWARTRSFLDPDTGRWNAPGLGNSVQSITWDQARRQRAIAQVVQQQTLHAPTLPTVQLEEKAAKPKAIDEEAIDTILFMDTVD